MKIEKPWTTGVVAIVMVLSLAWAWRVWRRDPLLAAKPNILVISTCSFRYKLLAEYSGLSEIIVPNLEKFFRNSSFIFNNAYNGIPWIAMSSYAEPLLPVSEIESYGYKSLSNTAHNYILRVPHRESWGYNDDTGVDDSDFEKNHQAETDFLKSKLLNGPRPFFVVAHYKYMHYPLIDRFNADSNWDRNLSVEERQKIAEYLNHPEKYPEKFPFLIMLSDDERVALSHPLIKKFDDLDDPDQRIRVKGLLTDPQMLRRWKESAGFAEDMVLLEKVYSANARYLDSVLGPILSLWDNPELQKNTIVIFAGDHGELHMEHDVLTHGSALFDDALHVPLAIHFPGVDKPVRVEGQMHYRILAAMIEGVMSGMVKAENFAKILPRVQEEAILLRDCINRHRGLRVNNDYKYIFDLGSDRAVLYDLKADPREEHDIAAERPDLVDRFEKKYWELYPEYTQVDPGSCYTWVGGREG